MKLLKTPLLYATLALVAASCNKKDVVEPNTTSASTVQAAIKVVDGRLVFADPATFEKTRELLGNLSKSANSADEISQWENSLAFTSLRKQSLEEGAHLESLVAQNKSTASYDLVRSFGMPLYLAALVNPEGEYQIGDKIYWYYDGFKYQASSQEELVNIKRNPTLAKEKFAAGSQVISSKQVASSGPPRTHTTLVTLMNMDRYCDDKYTSPDFNLNGVSGNRRRIIYGMNVYTEDNGSTPNNGARVWYSSLNLFIKYEYYSFGDRKWYPAGENFTYNSNVQYQGNVSMPYQLNYRPNQAIVAKGGSGTYTTGAISQQMDAYQLLSEFGKPNTQGDIRWQFEMKGIISGYPTSNPSSNYVVGDATNTYILW